MPIKIIMGGGCFECGTEGKEAAMVPFSLHSFNHPPALFRE
jgi:hypothetical protein